MKDAPDLENQALEQRLRASRAMHDAPQGVIDKAIDLWQTRPRVSRPAAGLPGGLRRLLGAELHFDSLGSGAVLAGQRSAAADPRQLLFTADGRDIDVRVTPSGGAAASGWSVSGQVLGRDAAGQVRLACGGFEAEAPWNDLCEFHFDSVPGGQCQLTLTTGDWELVLPAFELPARP